MAREVFRRSGNKPVARNLSVSVEGVARRVLADPGDYAARIVKAQLIAPGRGDNISVVLELIDPDSGEFFDIRPMWIAGPNAANGNMVGKNIAIITDLLDAIGIPRTSFKDLQDELLNRLVGKVFELTLDIDRGSRGGMFNVITIVHRAVDAAGDVVKFRAPAAD